MRIWCVEDNSVIPESPCDSKAYISPYHPFLLSPPPQKGPQALDPRTCLRLAGALDISDITTHPNNLW